MSTERGGEMEAPRSRQMMEISKHEGCRLRDMKGGYTYWVNSYKPE